MIHFENFCPTCGARRLWSGAWRSALVVAAGWVGFYAYFRAFTWLIARMGVVGANVAVVAAAFLVLAWIMGAE